MKMICVDVKKRGCEDVKMICVDVKMRISEDFLCRVKKTGCEDVKMICVDVNMRRCDYVKMYSRPPLLEEPFARTLSGKKE